MRGIIKKFFTINLHFSTKNEDYNRAYLLNALTLINGLLFLFFSIYNYLITKLYIVMVINILGLILVLLSIWVLRHQKNINLASSILVYSIFLTSTAFIYQEKHHDYALFYAVFFPFFSIFLLGIKRGLLFTSLYYAIFYLIIYQGIDTWGEAPFTIVSFTNIVVVTICLTLFAFYYETTRKASFAAIEKAHSKELYQAQKLKLALSELQEYKNNLEEKVQIILQEKLAQEQLLIQQSKMASMGEMLAAIAHQWKQPLTITTAIIGNLKIDLLLQGGESTVFDEGLNDILDQTQYMAQTITDFSGFFKPSTQIESFELKQSIDDVIVLLGEQLNSHCIDLHIDYPAFPITISGLRNEFLQVILNIINNAKDAIKEQHAKGNLAPGEGRIAIKMVQEGTLKTISVTDNGGGIPPQIIEKIFQPYFSTKPKESGTGIGLHMAKIIVEEKMGGNIKAENRDSGVVFTIEFKQ